MGVPIEYFEENHPLGTGGALLIISKKINEDFLVINGDTYFDVSLEKLKKSILEISQQSKEFFV